MKRMVVFTEDEWDEMKRAASIQVADEITRCVMLKKQRSYEDIVFLVDQAIRSASGDDR